MNAIIGCLRGPSQSAAQATRCQARDVLSHLGSGAVIWSRRIDDSLADTTTPDGFNQAVWAEWNAGGTAIVIGLLRASADHQTLRPLSIVP